MHVNAQAGQRPGNRMLYIGDIAFTPSPQRLVGSRRGVVAVENGIVSGCYESMDDVPSDWLDAPKTDFGDALVVEPMTSPWGLSIAERVEQFIYTGTPANISHRYVAGREIPRPFAE